MSLPEKGRLPEPMMVPGLPDTRPSILPFRIPRWPLWIWFIVGIAMIPVLSLPLMGVARYTTTSPQYCITCHGTGETPDRSVKSVVHPDFDRVSCVDCHAKPGQVVFEGYYKGFMAEPERVSSNCIRCHSSMTTTDDQEGFKFNSQQIRIPHKLHLDLGATCTTCHSNIAHDLRTPQTNRPTMESCNTCHAKTESCNKCHSGPIPGAPAPVSAPSTPDSSTDGRALYARACAACHGDKGDSIASANLGSKDFLASRGEADLIKATTEGKGGMPALGSAKGGPLTEDQVRQVVDYLKELSGGQ